MAKARKSPSKRKTKKVKRAKVKRAKTKAAPKRRTKARKAKSRKRSRGTEGAAGAIVGAAQEAADLRQRLAGPNTFED